ncbi:hypothetical protein [Salinicola acroporae]|nr:hypothetical protein [Salinicola acroporae]
MSNTDLSHTAKLAVAGLLAMAIMSASATAAPFECSSDNLMKHVSEQTREIDAYISNSDNPQQTQQALTSMARGLRESGQVSSHDDEMKQLASGAAFQPSQSFCDDMQTTMTAIQSYMESHPQ